MKYLFAALYLCAAVLQLIACASRDKLLLRRISKCLLMPLLALCYIFLAKTVSSLVVTALLCGFIGDVVLLFRPHRWAFPAGIVAFAAGHVFYIVSFLQAMPRFPGWYGFALFGVFAVACAVALVWFLWSGIPKRLRAPGFLYMLIIGSMASCAFLFALSGGPHLSWLAPFGAVLFIASDTTIALDAFRRPLRHRSIIVMSTYIAAQTLIVSSLAFY